MIEITWLFSHDNEGLKHVILKYTMYSVNQNEYYWFDTLKRIIDSKYKKISEIYTQEQHENVFFIENKNIGTIYNCPLIQGITYNDVNFFLNNYRNFFYIPNIDNFYNILGKEHPLHNTKMLNTKLMNEITQQVSESIRLFFIQKNLI